MDDSQHKATILAVDDSRVMLVAATKALRDEFEVLKATDGEEAWAIIQEHAEISVVFSDLSMPNMNGYELLDKIKASDNPQIANLPVVILTGKEDGDGTKEKVMQAGATDFLIKPFESLDLLSRARSLSRLNTQVNELSKKVSLDKLTRLYTEASYNDSAERALSYALRHDTALSVVRFDIAGFQALFIKHGKQQAESVLTKIAELIKSVLRQEDMAARLGVARFSLLLIETDQQGAEKVVTRLRNAIDESDFATADKISINIACVSPVINEKLQFKDISDAAEQAFEKVVAAGSGQTEVAKAATISGSAMASEPEKTTSIDLSAVLREIKRNNGQRLGAKQLNATLNTVIPLLSFLNDKMSLELDETINRLSEKVKK